MEVFLLSFVVFLLSGLGLAVSCLRGSRKAPRTSLANPSSEGFHGCGASCACVMAKRKMDDGS